MGIGGDRFPAGGVQGSLSTGSGFRTEGNRADILRGALTVPRVRHHAAIVEPRTVGRRSARSRDGMGMEQNVTRTHTDPN
jgi:hypothetical protein